MNELKDVLQSLYSDASKHSSYQSVPDFVTKEIGYKEEVRSSWRDDRPRMSYLLQNRVPASGELWLDFGANTGFFILSLANEFRDTEFIAVEANPNHSSFIEKIAKYFALDNVKVIQKSVGIRDLSSLPASDFLLHLNVLHHAGHDFDSDVLEEKEKFRDYAVSYLKLLGTNAKEMLFQVGSNWGGDKSLPIVDTFDDLKKLELFRSILGDSNWSDKKVSFASKDSNGRIAYVERKVDTNQHRFEFLDVFLGEFYRRPLFLCASN